MEDIAAGKVEFTSERADLEVELKATEDSIAKAVALRNQEHQDFLAAEAELEAAVKALEEAIKVMKDATVKPVEELVAVRSTAGVSFSQRQAEADLLKQAVFYGKRILSAGDAYFLERVLTGDVPLGDSTKLNRKATFKAKYHARSRDIMGVLGKMLRTFKKELAETREKEKNDANDFKKLEKSKNEQLDLIKDGLEQAVAEGAARDVVVADSNAEISDLEKQLEVDTKIIEDTKAALEEKTQEFEARKKMRAEEIAAISKAISILFSDDARDLFKESYTSQQLALLRKSPSSQRLAFLQLDAVSSAATEAQRRAGEVLRAAAHDGRVLGLALRLEATSAAGGRFDKVVEAIDAMIEKLKKEGKEDMKILDECKETRHKDESEAAKLSHAIDLLTDALEKLEVEIEAIQAEVKAKEETIAETEKAMKEAEMQREEEHAKWKKDDADDSAALVLVNNAKTVLERFYSDDAAMLQFVPKEYKMGEVKAGEAPPPPPPTWDAGYEKKTQESGNIVAMLGVIANDIENDLESHKKQEDKAQKDFDEFTEESKKELEDLAKAVDDLNEQEATKKETVVEKEKEKATKKEELDVLTKKMKDAEPGCGFYADNIEMRRKNRDIEIGALTDAKAILLGAKFQ